MTIPASFQVPPLNAPNQRVPLVTSDGTLTQNGQQTLQGVFGFCNGTNRIIPCNATGINVITLTMLPSSPLVLGYMSFDTYRAVAAATTTGTVTALVVTPQGSLATIKVFKSNGSTQATTGDIVIGLLYDFIFVNSLDSGNGGFVLR